jgi:hypothetical protein
VIFFPVQTPSKCPSKCPSKAARPSACIIQVKFVSLDGTQLDLGGTHPNLPPGPIWVPFGQQGWWPGQLYHATGQNRLFNVHSPPYLLLCLLVYHTRRKSLSVCNSTGTETRKARDWVRCPATFHLHRWAQAGLQGQGDHGCSTCTVVRWLTRRVAGSAQETGGAVPAGAGGGVLRQ